MTEAKEVLRVEHLSVKIVNGKDRIPVLEDVSFCVHERERWAIAGESGAGKSMMAKALTALMPEGSTELSGQILFRTEDGGWQDLLQMPYRNRHRFVAEQIALIFQDSINALNPNEKIEKQWGQTVLLHNPHMPVQEVEQHLLERMDIFSVRGGKETLQRFPDQLSGGMRQRIAIAMALESHAKILIADEPTTSLDAITQRGTVDFIKEIIEKRNMTMLFISHNLGLLQYICDHILIMKDGRIVEMGASDEMFFHAKEPYTKQLIRETLNIMGSSLMDPEQETDRKE